MPEHAVIAQQTVAGVKSSIDVDTEKAKPRLVALLFFDFTNMTGDGKVNLLGIFDEISVVTPVEGKITTLGVFVRTGDTIESTIEAECVSPQNEIVGGFKYSLPRNVVEAQVSEKHVVMQVLVPLQIRTPVAGTYWCWVSFEGENLGGAPLKVKFIDPPKEGAK